LIWSKKTPYRKTDSATNPTEEDGADRRVVEGVVVIEVDVAVEEEGVMIMLTDE